jgi:hypothetical protein
VHIPHRKLKATAAARARENSIPTIPEVIFSTSNHFVTNMNCFLFGY